MDKEKILIEIASYCDKELLNTVNSAIIQALIEYILQYVIKVMI